MGEPFLGELRIMSFSFPPKNWALCNGQLLPINQNAALFSLLGTNYGGDGRTTFALPNLQGRVPLHMGSGFSLGQTGGEIAHTLTVSELPGHFHQLTATSSDGLQLVPSGALLAKNANPGYHAASDLQPMAPESIGSTGGSQPHPNMMPSIALTFCIALVGIFPSRN
jgi:microcystin-dependent protein